MDVALLFFESTKKDSLKCMSNAIDNKFYNFFHTLLSWQNIIGGNNIVI